MLNVSDYTAHFRCLVSCSYWTIQSHNLSLKVVFIPEFSLFVPHTRHFYLKTFLTLIGGKKNYTKNLLFAISFIPLIPV